MKKSEYIDIFNEDSALKFINKIVNSTLDEIASKIIRIQQK